jgi:hypothetical protein
MTIDKFKDNIPEALMLIAVLLFILILIKFFKDICNIRNAHERLLEAENETFKVTPEAFVLKTEKLRASQDSLEQKAHQLNDLILDSQSALKVGNLFNLFSKQINKYQILTQARAEWSFIFAIFSMLAGLGLVVLGGVHIFNNSGWEHVAAATSISTLGGATGAFIAKTFLDVHRLSLSQLNHYFHQPVLNTHILTAQRLADQLEDKSARQRAYERIITNVASLIREENYPGEVWVPNQLQLSEVAPRNGTQKETETANSKSSPDHASNEQA